MTAPRDPYKILDVPRDAPLEAITKAYRKRARELHPDRNPGEDTTAAFQDAADSYALLSDPKRRRLYDASGVWDNPIDNRMAVTGNILATALRTIWEELAQLGSSPSMIDMLNSLRAYVKAQITEIDKVVRHLNKIKTWAAMEAMPIKAKKKKKKDAEETNHDAFLAGVLAAQARALDNELTKATEAKTNYQTTLDFLADFENNQQAQGPLGLWIASMTSASTR
jgi:curved DNA-binding protein CbpA